MGRKYFGTDGVRGRVGESPITPEIAETVYDAARRLQEMGAIIVEDVPMPNTRYGIPAYFVISRVASKPLTGVMFTSINTIAGLSFLTICTASSPLEVSPTTVNRGSLFRINDHESLINLWSSTRIIEILLMRIS